MMSTDCLETGQAKKVKMEELVPNGESRRYSLVELVESKGSNNCFVFVVRNVLIPMSD